MEGISYITLISDSWYLIACLSVGSRRNPDSQPATIVADPDRVGEIIASEGGKRKKELRWWTGMGRSRSEHGARIHERNVGCRKLQASLWDENLMEIRVEVNSWTTISRQTSEYRILNRSLEKKKIINRRFLSTCAYAKIYTCIIKRRSFLEKCDTNMVVWLTISNTSFKGGKRAFDKYSLWESFKY